MPEEDEMGVAQSLADVPICPGCGLMSQIVRGELCRECWNRREARCGGGGLVVVPKNGDHYHETPLCPGLNGAEWWYWRDESVCYAALAGDLRKCARCDRHRLRGFDAFRSEDEYVVSGHGGLREVGSS